MVVVCVCLIASDGKTINSVYQSKKKQETVVVAAVVMLSKWNGR